MKKCIIIPDSFKGTLSAIQICDIMKKSVVAVWPDCTVITVPVADGGEGTVDCFLYALHGEKVTVAATGPFGEPIKALYAIIGDTAVIETASCAGLPLAEGRLNPCVATTYGLGALVLDAVHKGVKQIVIGLGGSCTNDGGTGLARALGTVFFDENRKQFAPHSDEFMRISYIDNKKTLDMLKNVKIIAMCDVDNPLTGPRGASFVFGPQKGADPATVSILNANLAALSGSIKKDLRIDCSMVKGAGAAGGLGGGVVAFLGGTLRSGIETVLDMVGFDSMLEGSDMVFTGEGRIDSQSFQGKVISGIAERTSKAHVPLTVIAGDIGDIPDDVYERGITSIFSINRKALPFSEIRKFSAEYMAKTVADVLRLYRSGETSRS
jgi:glycerate kinase